LPPRSQSLADEAIARVLAHKDVFGITRVANLTGLDRTGIPVVMVCRPNARSSAVFNGKGLDVGAAKASALMEAAETWHAENIALPLRFSSFVDLCARRTVIDVEGLPRRPGADFDPYAPLLWIEGRNLMDGRAVWTPFEIVHADSRMAGPPMSGCFSMSTNGLASGRTFFAAVSHALCELIERDATALWRQSGPEEHSARRFDLSTIDDPNALSVVNRLNEGSLDVAVWDITTDVGVCAFQCLVVDRDSETDHIGVGAACHPNRAVAFSRAVLEAAQVRTTYIIGSREDIEPTDYAPTTLASRKKWAGALLAGPRGSTRFPSSLIVSFETAEAEVAWILDRLRSIGLAQAVAVDLTQPEYAIPVVRMIVPGLEGSDHHQAQYVPGRRARARQERAA
jgi:YcaO-like protein with predicted kinase domain